MWVFTNRGMVSVVQHREDSNTLIVRARARHHLEAFGVPLAAIEESPEADYRWRVSLPREEVARLIAAAALAIDYPNFKNSVAEPAYHHVLMPVWSQMASYQDRQHRGRG